MGQDVGEVQQINVLSAYLTCHEVRTRQVDFYSQDSL